MSVVFGILALWFAYRVLVLMSQEHLALAAVAGVFCFLAGILAGIF